MVIAVLVTALLVAAGAVLRGTEDSHGVEVPSGLRDNADVASFLASEFLPDDVKQCYLEAMVGGGLAPERLIEATESWRAISEKRCTRLVISVSETELRLERVADGAEWGIGIGPKTRASRGRESFPATELRRGELVEALSKDGITAGAVIIFSEPVPRRAP
ncbi:MAG: hypothetical protein GEU75_10600 [Dehalococcoidia bacterium]|nr:hypothetical protein [Dehalococcoidia bacterium]